MNNNRSEVKSFINVAKKNYKKEKILNYGW